MKQACLPGRGPTLPWRWSSSRDAAALAVVDGLEQHEGRGPHYSRRTPGSQYFTGVGKEVVFVTESGDAVWAVVLQKTPAPRGSGSSRGRTGKAAPTRWVWRNMLFRNLGPTLTSDLIRAATESTYRCWVERYGALPSVPLRTEVQVNAVRSSNPGYCYQCAGWTKGETKRGKLFLYAPESSKETVHS